MILEGDARFDFINSCRILEDENTEDDDDNDALAAGIEETEALPPLLVVEVSSSFCACLIFRTVFQGVILVFCLLSTEFFSDPRSSSSSSLGVVPFLAFRFRSSPFLDGGLKELGVELKLVVSDSGTDEDDSCFLSVDAVTIFRFFLLAPF